MLTILKNFIAFYLFYGERDIGHSSCMEISSNWILFYHVGSGEEAQVIRPGGKSLYAKPYQLTGLISFSYKLCFGEQGLSIFV